MFNTTAANHFGSGLAWLVVDGARLDVIGFESIRKEMSAVFDQRFGLPYGLMTATVKGSRQPSDTNTRVADAATMVEKLLLAFDASREQQYLADARTTLQPLLDDRAGLRTQGSYASGSDLKGLRVAPTPQSTSRTPRTSSRPPANYDATTAAAMRAEALGACRYKSQPSTAVTLC